ncbi:MAG: YihA family ribosome biogenesis GTP-binding protein [Bacteroidetes bacterium]|nr:YihA family ribosome biogenesis GTP-binding protein [Bacteroidota bacterium]
MTIKSAKFIKSYATIEKMETSDKPEFAFIGRSNVGKSSLINMLANQKSLAKTSSKPGKTQLINEFNINNVWTLIDLPGYGFAKVNDRKKARFSAMIMDYLENRKNLYSAFVLVDARLKPQRIDLEFVEWCGVKQVPFQIIFTKTDKIKKTQLAENVGLFEAAMYKQGWEDLPNRFITSSKNGAGKDEILDFIEGLVKS